MFIFFSINFTAGGNNINPHINITKALIVSLKIELIPPNMNKTPKNQLK